MTQMAVVDFWFSHFILVLLKKIFMVMKELDIGLRPDTLTTITQMGVVDFRVALFLHVMLTKVFTIKRGVIKVMIMEYVDLGIMRP